MTPGTIGMARTKTKIGMWPISSTTCKSSLKSPKSNWHNATEKLNPERQFSPGRP